MVTDNLLPPVAVVPLQRPASSVQCSKSVDSHTEFAPPPIQPSDADADSDITPLSESRIQTSEFTLFATAPNP